VREAFKSELILRALSPAELLKRYGSAAKQYYELWSALEFESGWFGQVLVPAGFTSDFASVPRAARWYVDDDDPDILYPSIIHDYLYACGGRLPNGHVYTRAQADQVLREAMQAVDARPDRIQVVYLAVRAGGAEHWKEAA
jgi:hypothetical protein